MTDAQPLLCHLQREHDVSGVSGTGRVANGVLWPDGTVAVRWVGERPSTVHWDRLEDAIAVHGHGGATRIVWDDEMAASLARDGFGPDEIATMLRQPRTQQCGHDDYHDAHEWAYHPHIWCPGHSLADEEPQ